MLLLPVSQRQASLLNFITPKKGSIDEKFQTLTGVEGDGTPSSPAARAEGGEAPPQKEGVNDDLPTGKSV